MARKWRSLAGLMVLLIGYTVTGCLMPPVDPQTVAAKKVEPPREVAMDEGEMLFEDFDGTPVNGGWFAAFDSNGLGTSVQPNPFELQDEGCPDSPVRSARLWGHLGADAAPWSWAQIGLPTIGKTRDLNQWKTVTFWAKGSPGEYLMQISREAVADSDHFHMKFPVTEEWTKISLPLDKFRQFGWGKRLPRDFSDVVNVMFYSKRHDSDFDLWVDHIVFSKNKLDTKNRPYDASDWFAYEGIDVEKRKGTALDVSYLLDAPAGKHGWINVDGEDFVFEDGTPARFWGVNIVASSNFPSKEIAVKTAELLAQMGVNMTRHHHFDAPWTNENIFGKNGQTRTLSADEMDRFDFFINELQKRGIYQYMDLLVHRKAYEADGITEISGVGNGYKGEGEFAPELIALQEQFTSQFLNHKNPYSGKTYGNDPAFCLMEIINEDSLFYIQKTGDFAIESPYYRKILAAQFSEWLHQRYDSIEDLRAAWGGTLSAKETFTDKNINGLVTFGDGGEQGVHPQRAKDTYAFYYDLTMTYFKRMREVVRASGSKAPITGSNHWVGNPIDLYANAQLDFIDRHDYWSHPQGGWNLDMITHDNSPMIKHSSYGLIGGVGNRRVGGLPYIVTEWQAAVPNDYRHDCNFAMAAYSSFQNWSGVQFAWTHENNAMDPAKPQRLFQLFNILDQPTFVASWPSSALMYHRQDVARADDSVYMPLTREQVFDPSVRNPLRGKMALAYKTGLKFGDSGSMPDQDALLSQQSQGTTVMSSTTELKHDSVAGLFSVDTARTQGAAVMKTKEAVALTNLSMQLENEFSVVILSALSAEPISRSSRLLLTALGNIANEGMVRDFAGDRIPEAGHLPIRVEPIKGQIRIVGLEGPIDNCKVYALSPSGERITEVPLSMSENVVSFEIGATYKTMYYEVVRN